MPRFHCISFFLGLSGFGFTAAAQLMSGLPPAQIFCSQENTKGDYPTIEIKENTRLEAHAGFGKEACGYKLKFVIVKSGITLDCQDAKIIGAGAEGSVGIQIGRLDAAESLKNVTVKNCNVENFDTNFAVFSKTRTADDLRYQSTDNITIEDSESDRAKTNGFYLGPLVSGVLLKKIQSHHAGASGLFMAEGATRNIVVSGKFFANGTDQTLNDRNGVSLDAAPKNQIIASLFEDNAQSGIATFKNCGEHQKPWPSFEAGGNSIRSNHFHHEKVGVWIGAKQSLNQKPLDCAAPKTFNDSAWTIVEDFSKDNQIVKNLFTDVELGARIEDDGNRLVDNTFTATKPGAIAALISSRFGRPRELRRPIERTQIENNRLTLTTASPFQYCFMQAQTQIQGNTNAGKDTNQLTLAGAGCAILDAAPGRGAPAAAPAAPPAQAPVQLRGMASEAKPVATPAPISH